MGRTLLLLMMCMFCTVHSVAIQFTPSIAGMDTVGLVNTGTGVFGSFTLTGPLDGMGIRVDPNNASLAQLFVNIEATSALLVKLTLERAFPFAVIDGETLFGPSANGYVGSRLCSGTLVNGLSFAGLGSTESMWFGAEESASTFGRALAFLVDGTTFHHITAVGIRNVRLLLLLLLLFFFFVTPNEVGTSCTLPLSSNTDHFDVH
jgi:hypothetical protein